MIAIGLNFCRHLAGSSFRSRVKFCQEPARSFFQAFSFSPVLPSFAAAHVTEHAARSVGNVRKVVGEIQNVEC